MRVTLVANELRGLQPAGGMGTATAFLALALARMGQTTEILIGREPDRPFDPYWESLYRDAGIRVTRADATGERVEPVEFGVRRNIEHALRRDPPDVVIFPDFGAPAYAALRLKQAGLAFDRTLFVAFCHGTRRYVLDYSRNITVPDLRHLLAVGVLERISVELADVVVSPSGFLLEWMHERGWQLPDRAIVIPYLTRPTATGEPVEPGPADEQVPLRRITFFGRLDEKKGLTTFAAGLDALGTRLANLEVEFLGKESPTWPRERIANLLSNETRKALRPLSFETHRDQHEALARLSAPGTLAVIPSPWDNSPNTVYECLEHGIPFVASDVGGIPELIDPKDSDRVLFPPTPDGVATALRRALSAGAVRPARPAFSGQASLDAWADVIAMRPKRREEGSVAAVDVVVIDQSSGKALEEAEAPFVLLLDSTDVPDAELVATLQKAQCATDADVVTCGLRIAADHGTETLQFFSGEPGGLGVLQNDYGTVALVRRTLVHDLEMWRAGEGDSAWPFLARLAANGARIVSVPVPLVASRARPGTVERDPVAALAVLEHLERSLPHPLRSLARLATGTAADLGAEVMPARNAKRGRVRRRLRRPS